MKKEDEIIPIRSLNPMDLDEIIQQLLDRLGYEVRANKEDREYYLCEKIGMTGARGEHDDDY